MHKVSAPNLCILPDCGPCGGCFIIGTGYKVGKLPIYRDAARWGESREFCAVTSFQKKPGILHSGIFPGKFLYKRMLHASKSLTQRHLSRESGNLTSRESQRASHSDIMGTKSHTAASCRKSPRSYTRTSQRHLSRRNFY